MKNLHSNTNNLDLTFVLLVLIILWVYGTGKTNASFSKFLLFLNKTIDDGRTIIDEKKLPQSNRM